MAKVARTLTYEEFVAGLPEVLDDLAREGDVVLVDKNGSTFRVALAEPDLDPRLPPLKPLDVRLRALRKSAGGLKGVDIERLKADLRIQREQDSTGRPA